MPKSQSDKHVNKKKKKDKSEINYEYAKQPNSSEARFAWRIYLIAPLLVGFGIGVSTLITSHVFKEYLRPKKQIILGLTAHPTFEIDKHQNLVENKITDPVNHLLGKYDHKYEFITSIRGIFKYDELFESLYHKRIDLGFFSPYAYIEAYLKNDRRLESFKYIGQKYMPTGQYYYSGMVIPKHLIYEAKYFSYSNLKKHKDDLINKLTSDTSITYVLNCKKNSTSTRIIPELILCRNEIKPQNILELTRSDFVELLKKTINPNPQKMPVKINNPNSIVGFMSSDDWLYACEQDSSIKHSYSYVCFDEYPIPLDPVLAHKCERRKFRRKSKILELLRQWIYVSDGCGRGSGMANEWIERNKDFIKLVLSGKIISNSANSDTITVSFLNSELQSGLIHQYEDKQVSLGLFKIKVAHETGSPDLRYKYKFEPILTNDKLKYEINDVQKSAGNELVITLNNALGTSIDSVYVIPELQQVKEYFKEEYTDRSQCK